MRALDMNEEIDIAISRQWYKLGSLMAANSEELIQTDDHECAMRFAQLSEECRRKSKVTEFTGPEYVGIVNQIDPEIGYPNDDLLRRIHADIEIRGRKNPDFAVSVHHRNIVLSAVANALRNSHLLTWDEWLEHCGWPKEDEVS